MKNSSKFLRQPSNSNVKPARSAGQSATQAEKVQGAGYVAASNTGRESANYTDNPMHKSVSRHATPTQSYSYADATNVTECNLWGTNDEYEMKWYVMRSTYGRERQVAELLKDEGIDIFCPTVMIRRRHQDKIIEVECPLLPNLFFAYASKVVLKSLMHELSGLKSLRFYCRKDRVGCDWRYTPLCVPIEQLDSFRIICSVRESDTLFLETEAPKFSQGQLVRVNDGKFKGVIGRVARFRGQQRVAVTLEGIITSVTAYVPSAFLEPV